jgi:hypothetical protein
MKHFIACELAKKTTNSHHNEVFHFLHTVQEHGTTQYTQQQETTIRNELTWKAHINNTTKMRRDNVGGTSFQREEKWTSVIFSGTMTPR